MKDIHKGGRPLKYNDVFYKSIVHEYDSGNTYKMICKNHKVSMGTVRLWLKKGRELIADEVKESE